MNIKNIKLTLGVMFAAVVGLTSCVDEPDKYESTGGKPTIQYVRLADVTAKDSLLSGAFMQTPICIVGENLRSIVKLYFNDQKAVLNTSYMTDNTLIVSVPGGIPTDVTDKIYFVTSGNDTVSYDFKVLVPAPSVASISNEFARPGDLVSINGDFFLDDPNVPLEVTMPGNVALDRKYIKEIKKNSIVFEMPEGIEPGFINVKSIYGNGRSKFYIYDKRNILFDWDGLSGGLAQGAGWRDGSKLKHNDGDDEFPSLDGTPYIAFGGAELDGGIGATWAEDNYCFNFWPDEDGSNALTNMFPQLKSYLEEYGIDGLQMKFEVYVPEEHPWSSCGMQIMLTSLDNVTQANAQNGYYSSTALPRGLWMPWAGTGTYFTKGWETVSVKLSDFNKTHEGGKSDAALGLQHFAGLTFFVWHGGVAGTTCNPIIAVDNIRIVPIEK